MGLVELLVVHCSDARDMHGHYPPICYPAHGWSSADRGEPSECTVRVGHRDLRMRIYNFRRSSEVGSTQRLRILNVFQLPDGTTSADLPRFNFLREHVDF